LLDLNVLIALTDSEHQHYAAAQAWFDAHGKRDFGICPLTEAGFIRLTTNPNYPSGPRSVDQAIAILQALQGHQSCRYWEIKESWVTLTAPFAARVSGHQQVSDAYLLGLAIKENGVLVTFDRGIKYMAGPEFAHNLVILQ
jgi:toxin-antitoxin system PIN domain toxin